jgi:hypothetical protein
MRIGKIKRNISILILVNMLAVLCAASTGCNTTVQPVDSLEDLIGRLEKSGLEIEITDRPVQNIHLSVEGYVFMIGSENTQLFEYTDVSTAKMEFEALTGPGPGLVFFEKNEPPLSESVSSNLKAYHSGQFILPYSGDNEDVKKALKAAFGPPAQPR